MSYEAKPADVPATTILIESCGIRPRGHGEIGNPTLPLPVILISQLGAMAFRKGHKRPKQIRLLAMAGTPVTAKRLENWGFVKTGRQMRNVPSVDLYTLTVSNRGTTLATG